MPESREDFLSRVDATVARIRYRRDTYRFKVAQEPEGQVYVQLYHDRPDAVTGVMGVGRGGKVYLERGISNSAIVRRCFGAALAYEEHEVREFFTYRPEGKHEFRRIFGPHGHIDTLWDAAHYTE